MVVGGSCEQIGALKNVIRPMDGGHHGENNRENNKRYSPSNGETATMNKMSRTSVQNHLPAETK
jgi:hypothetical protein